MTSPTCILAYVDGDGDFDHAARAALERATAHKARLIYYDSSSASHFSEPVSSNWSADGEGEQYGNPLSDGELEALGRAPIASLVRTAKAAGVDAWGWLASDKGMSPFFAYAAEQSVDLAVVPEEARPDLDEVGELPIPVEVVATDG